MSSFEAAFPYILKHEGVYSDNPNDPGGVTKYGISLRYLMTNKERGDINHDGVINGDDIKSLTIGEAARLYKEDFWDKNKLFRIDNQFIATKALDMNVNMGVYANKLLQRAVNALLPPSETKLVVDGILGEKSFKTINSFNSTAMMFAICQECVKFYNSLVAEKPKLGVFLKGWLTRANSTCGLDCK